MKTIRKFTVCFLVLTLLLTPCSYASAVETPAAEEPVVRVGEVESLRETNSETYLMSDGTYECVVYAENKYYLDENEVLQPINNAIVAASGGANLLSTQYTNTANAFDVTFSGSGTPEISITYGEAGITFVPVDATGSGNMHMTASASAVAIGGVENCSTLSQLTATGSNTATYANAFGTADLVYVLENDALKEYIILEDSAAPNSYNFLFTLDGVTLQETDTGAAFLNAAGEAAFYLGGLFAVDANGVPTDALTYTFQQIKDTIIGVTVTLDDAYLAAADRAFPVVIDPTVMISSSADIADACVCSKYPSTNYYMAVQLRTGYDTDYETRRSLIRFSIPSSIPADRFASARLEIEKISGGEPNIAAYRITEEWTSSTVNWQNQPEFTATGQSAEAEMLRTGSNWYRLDVSNIVESWVNGSYTNHGFMLKEVLETSLSDWVTWYSSDADSPHKPELYISYRPVSFVIDSYYDRLFPTAMVSEITGIIGSVNSAYQRQFGVSLISSGYPISTMITEECTGGTELPCSGFCSTGHHIEIWNYMDYLDSISTSGEIAVLWSDRSSSSVCNHETGSCVKYTSAAGLASERRGVFIVDIPSTADTTNKKIAAVTIILLHELAHYFGLEEQYNKLDLSHDGATGYQCVMEEFHADDYENFYDDTINNRAYAFCTSCQNQLEVLLGSF